MSGPLNGVRVLDLSINVLGPLSCQILGDMGADVIKIETPQGDPQRSFGPSRNPGMSAFYMNLNRNKRSIVLNLKQPAALEALMQLVDQADVLVHSMRLQAAERLGIGYDAISARNPRIIYACGTGYSQKGPKRDLAAYDDVIQGESGIADLFHRNSGRPGYIPMPFADKFCAYAQASAIGMALFAREKSGRGQAVYTPMLETLISFNMFEHLWGATFEPPVSDIGYPRMFSKYRRPFQTGDSHLCLLAHTDDQWRRVFKVIEQPYLIEDPRFCSISARSRNVDALYGVLSEALKEKTTAQWQLQFDSADIPNSPVARLDQLLETPYLNQTAFFQHLEHPSEGRVVNTKVPVEFSDTVVGAVKLAPRLGEHSDAVLSDLGYSAAAIAEMAK